MRFVTTDTGEHVHTEIFDMNYVMEIKAIEYVSLNVTKYTYIYKDGSTKELILSYN